MYLLATLRLGSAVFEVVFLKFDAFFCRRRRIHYKCVRIEAESNSYAYLSASRILVNDRHCSVIPKPDEYEPCEGHCESVQWVYNDWSLCSRTCGGGRQRRTAKCVDSDGQVVSDSHCNEHEKVVERGCNEESCPAWVTGDWSSVSTALWS